MRARWAWALMALAACSGRSACSSGARGSNASRAASDQACAAWATQYCDRLDFCAPLSVEVAYGDVARCIDRNRPLCTSALEANGTGSGPASLEACARAYDAASCDDVVVGRAPASCKSTGTLPQGAPCGDDSQCAGAGSYCHTSAAQACGTCATLGAAEAPCESDKDCEYGLVCYFTCMPPVTLGAECDGMTRQCPQTLVCYDYVCVAPAPVGAGCKPRADACDRDHGLFCDPHARVCARYAVADVGAPCGAGTICKGSSCESMNGPTMGDPGLADPASTCAAYARDGAKCDATSGPSCTPPAGCVRDVCQMPEPSTCR
jgi:hypothetical protein